MILSISIMSLRDSQFAFLVFLSQIFGICLAQNLVSDIEAVRASW